MKKVVVALALIAAMPRTSDACTCWDRSRCEAFRDAPIVFIGKAVAVTDGRGWSTHVRFAVAEKLKGSVGDHAIVEGGGTCGALFEQGKTYIVYASQSSGRLLASLCGGTAPLDEAGFEVAYARSFHTRTAGVVEGTITIDDEWRTPGVNVEVRVRGTKLRTRADESGRYLLELPPGTHALDVIGAETIPAVETVNVADRHSCAARNIEVLWNGSIRGRVSGVDGKPAANVEVTVFGVGTTRTRHRFARTDHAGNYVIGGLPVGEYAVLVERSNTVPTTTFYPGVSDSARATHVRLARPGVQGIDFTLRP